MDRREAVGYKSSARHMNQAGCARGSGMVNLRLRLDSFSVQHVHHIRRHAANYFSCQYKDKQCRDTYTSVEPYRAVTASIHETLAGPTLMLDGPVCENYGKRGRLTSTLTSRIYRAANLSLLPWNVPSCSTRLTWVKVKDEKDVVMLVLST